MSDSFLPSRRSVLIRSVAPPVLFGLVAGALAAVVVPSTGRNAPPR